MIGALLVDKPVGPSSFQVVSRLRKHFKLKRVGHCGTLDPLASGLLILLVEEGTKFQRYIQFDRKEYTGVIQLGVSTPTLDLESEINAQALVPELTAQSLSDAANQLVGVQLQRPPAFSAVKIDGKRAYRRARDGEEFELPEREVELYSLKLELIAKDKIGYRLSCSSGFFVRSLARDLAIKLGTLGVTAEIRRSAVGGVSLADATSLEGLLALEIPPLTPLNRLVALPILRVEEDVSRCLRLGQHPVLPRLPQSDSVLTSDSGEFLGVVGDKDGTDYLIRFMVNVGG